MSCAALCSTAFEFAAQKCVSRGDVAKTHTASLRWQGGPLELCSCKQAGRLCEAD